MFLSSDITLKAGDSGDAVSELQRRLAQRDLLHQANISGLFDGNTTQAVMEFQTLNGLRVDGIAGPETLRRLISIGGAGSSDAASGSGDASNDDDETKNATNLERFDAYTMANTGAVEEQSKLANEAVWGYGDHADSAVQQQQGQQQLSDLTRYNAQDEALQMQRQQQQIAAQPPSQLEFTAQGVQAQSIAKELEKPPEKAAEKAPEKVAELERPIERPLAVEVKSEIAPVASAALAPRDPALLRTEAKLDASSRSESQQEGQKLDKKGVRDVGTVPEAALGQLSPARSPAIERNQQIGLS